MNESQKKTKKTIKINGVKRKFVRENTQNHPMQNRITNHTNHK